jgi:galactonate dehydratase
VRIAEFRRTVVGAPRRELIFVELIFAELVTDDGLTGVGEVRMVNKTRTLLACVEELAPRYVLGTDPFGAASSELPAAERRRSVAIVAAVRDAVGPDVRIMAEMHGRFTTAEAGRVAELLAPYDPAWIEEPVPPDNPAALEPVRRATRIPIATGERLHVLAEFRELFERGLVDVVQADLTHFGLADRWVADLVDGALAVDPADGCFALPAGPGLGVRLDREACLAHPPTGARLELFREGWETRHQEGG